MNRPQKIIALFTTFILALAFSYAQTYSEPSNAQPKIVLNYESLSIQDQDTKSVVATITNVTPNSPRTTFNISSSVEGTESIVTPASTVVNLADNESKQITFSIKGYKEGNGKVCFTAQTRSQFGGKTDEDCLNLTVKERTTPFSSCGNGICDFGDQLSCPEDCQNTGQDYTLVLAATIISLAAIVCVYMITKKKQTKSS